MKRTIFILFLALITIFLNAREVSNNNQAIAYAVPGDYITRSSGERLVLKQSDIDYARKQLGLTTPQNTQNRTPSTGSYTQSSSYASSAPTDTGSGPLVILILVVVVIVIIIAKSVSNITTTVAKILV
ncbi:MAG: hypothetical protein FWD78_04415 [Treponema sp.]|nr:hypothetical protein [Treponema sp.]